VKEVLNSGLSVITKENAANVTFFINMQWTSPVFSDVRFRKALNLAIDKESIIKNLFAGLARPTTTYPGTIWERVGAPKLKPYPYDPQEAKRLIKEGGWEGHEFTLMSYAREGCPEFPLVVEAIAGYWQQIGLKPRIRMSEWTTWRNIIREQKTQNTIHGVTVTTNPELGGLLTNWSEKYNFKSKLCIANVPELTEKVGRIEKSLDLVEIQKLGVEIYRSAHDNYFMISICEIPDMIATTKRIPKWDLGDRRNDRNYYDLIKQR
jgi:peptide/nickel transport system substrate-binding protein